MHLLHKLKVILSDLIYGRQLQNVELKKIMDVQSNQVNENRQKLEKINETVPINVANELNQDDSVVTLPLTTPLKLVKFINIHPELVFPHVLKKLTMAINTNLSSIKLYKLDKGKILVDISRPTYEAQLNLMMDWFVSVEDYESATNCRDLIRKIKTV